MPFLPPNQQCQSTEGDTVVPDKGPLNGCVRVYLEYVKLQLLFLEY